MKKGKMIGLVGLLLFFASTTQAQTLEEWFNQKQTQIKYLVQQIAALQVYLGYLEKGYTIAHDGLTLISGIKNGELNLHKDYFGSLKTVNPKVMQYSKIAAIITLQAGMVEQCREAVHQAQASGAFSAAETDYIRKVCGNLLQEADKDLDELVAVTTTGQLQMTDDERITAIDRIYRQTRDKQSFLRDFSDRVLQLAAARRRGQTDARLLETLYGQP